MLTLSTANNSSTREGFIFSHSFIPLPGVNEGDQMSNYEPEVTQAVEEAEQALLGSIFLLSSGGQTKAIKEVSKIVAPFDFRGCVKTNRPDQWIWTARIYYAMLECQGAPHIINVAKKMIDLDILQDNDCSLMQHCIYLTPCALDYLDYAKIVKDESIKRSARYYAQKGEIKKLRQLINSDKSLGTVPL